MEKIDEMPFNHVNKLITPKELKKIVKHYKNIDLYRTAFTHKSYSYKNIDINYYCPPKCVLLQEKCNERLEFLGDSILSSSVAHYLYERYEDQNEGFLSKIRSRLVNGDMLAYLSKKIELYNYILISKQIENSLGRTNPKILEDVLEAFIAAIYLDLGFDYTKEWIVNLLETNIDFSQIINKENYKDQFVKLYQNKFGCIPKFIVNNLPNSKSITVNIIDNDGKIIAVGKGRTKKIAEEKASIKALGYNI